MLVFALLAAAALLAEVLIYLLDIHAFRDLWGAWSIAAYLVLGMGALAAALLGWGIVLAGREAARVRRRHLAAAGIAGLATILLAAGAAAPHRAQAAAPAPTDTGAPPANILILLVDSLRPDHLSAYGYPLPTSPAIDRLAAEGVLCRNAYATSNWTVPTHASVFTGLYPSAHGAYSLYSALDPSVPTLAQILSAGGYETASFYGNRLLGSRYGLSRGFRTALGVDSEHKVSLALFRVLEIARGERSVSGRILAAAGRWAEECGRRRRPFLLFVNLMDAHMPYRPRQPYAREFLRSLPPGAVNMPLARRFTTGDMGAAKEAAELFARLSAADWRWLERLYDSNVRAVDDRIGSFLGRLRRSGLLGNTLVILTSDHGEFFGEAGVGGHRQLSMHDAGLRIPPILWFPRRLAAGVIERRLSQVDLLPTVLAIAGRAGAVPDDAHGRDIFSPGPDGGEILVESWDDRLGRFSRAFFSGDLKLVIGASGSRRLHDLSADPQGAQDLAGQRPGQVASLSLRLKERLKAMPFRMAVDDASRKQEQRKLLRSLGYL
jgi:arylsulfatase A-like enzyme